MNITERSPVELFQQVKDYYPQAIIQYLAEHEGITFEDAKERWAEMIKFLVLSVSFERSFAPSEKVDPAWHAFVLHTQEYEQFCLSNFGCFVHHVPKLNPIEEYLNTKEEIERAFPNEIHRPHLWARDAKCSCVGQCAEKGCRKKNRPRSQALQSIQAFSGS